MGRLIGIDYGTKRVGLATTDPLKLIANTLTTVHANDVIPFLKEYIAKEEVECFVVGKPMKLDGSDSQSAVHVEKFVHLLDKNFPDIPVKMIDERFTSAIATRSMLEMGLKKKDRAKKSNVDQISAVLILQTYMQMEGN
ncbi:MAG: Holliday junction resolvase RuvX [Bacteroidota bacterium]